MKLFGVAVFVLVLGTFTQTIFCASSANFTATECNEMAKHIHKFVEKFLMADLPEDVRKMQTNLAFLTTGVNVEDIVDLKTMACKVLGSKSVKQLAAALKLPPSTVKRFYREWTNLLELVGGTEGLEKALSLSEYIITAAKMTGFPNWPPNGTVEAAKLFFQDVLDGFGEDLIVMTELDELYIMKVHIEQKDLGTWAKAMIESRTIMEFASATGLNKLKLAMMSWSIKQYIIDPKAFERYKESIQAFIDLAKAFETHNLIGLPINTKKSKNKNNRKPVSNPIVGLLDGSVRLTSIKGSKQ